MVVVAARTQMIGVRTPGPDIAIREGEEGVVVEIDNLTGVGEVAGVERHNIHKGIRRPRNGVVPRTTPAQYLRPVLVTHTINNRPTVLLGNGVTVRML